MQLGWLLLLFLLPGWLVLFGVCFSNCFSSLVNYIHWYRSHGYGRLMVLCNDTIYMGNLYEIYFLIKNKTSTVFVFYESPFYYLSHRYSFWVETVRGSKLSQLCLCWGLAYWLTAVVPTLRLKQNLRPARLHNEYDPRRRREGRREERREGEKESLQLSLT